MFTRWVVRAECPFVVRRQRGILRLSDGDGRTRLPMIMYSLALLKSIDE